MHTTIRQVSRKRSSLAPILTGSMILFGVLFLLAGITLDRGFMLPCFLMAALYYVYGILSRREYEYTFKDHTLTIDGIYGRSLRRNDLVIDFDEMVVLAPHDAEIVADYRKGGRKQPKHKYDFTSYEEGVPYYTLILRSDGELCKVLLDLDEDVLEYLKRRYPDKVYRS